MNSAGLREEQVEKLALSVRRMRSYLAALTGRMHQRHFPRDDPLKVAADNAFDAVATLMVEVERLESTCREER